MVKAMNSKKIISGCVRKHGFLVTHKMPAFAEKKSLPEISPAATVPSQNIGTHG